MTRRQKRRTFIGSRSVTHHKKPTTGGSEKSAAPDQRSTGKSYAAWVSVGQASPISLGADRGRPSPGSRDRRFPNHHPSSTRRQHRNVRAQRARKVRWRRQPDHAGELPELDAALGGARTRRVSQRKTGPRESPLTAAARPDGPRSHETSVSHGTTSARSRSRPRVPRKGRPPAGDRTGGVRTSKRVRGETIAWVR